MLLRSLIFIRQTCAQKFIGNRAIAMQASSSKIRNNNAGCAQFKKIRREFTFEALFWKTRRSKIFRRELLYIVNEQFAACGLQVILDKVYMHGV